MNKPTAKTIANLICGLILGITNKNGLEVDAILTKNELLEMATLLENKKINNQGVTQIIDYVLKSKNVQNNDQTDKFEINKEENQDKIKTELEYKLENKLENEPKNIEQIAKELTVLQESDDKILAQIAQTVIDSNPKQVGEYARKPQIINFLVGQCMKAAKGQGNSGLFSDILKMKLEQNLIQNVVIES